MSDGPDTGIDGMDGDNSYSDSLTRAIIGAAFEVANQLGHGFAEAVYKRALLAELEIRGLSPRHEVQFAIRHKERPVGTYIADLVVDDVIVELKVAETIVPAHVGQVLNYLKASGCRAGLLFNFGKPRLEFRKIGRPS